MNRIFGIIITLLLMLFSFNTSASGQIVDTGNQKNIVNTSINKEKKEKKENIKTKAKEEHDLREKEIKE